MSKKENSQQCNREKDVLHPPGVEPNHVLALWSSRYSKQDYSPGPIAWKAIILPLDQECLIEPAPQGTYIYAQSVPDVQLVNCGQSGL